MRTLALSSCTHMGMINARACVKFWLRVHAHLNEILRQVSRAAESCFGGGLLLQRRARSRARALMLRATQGFKPDARSLSNQAHEHGSKRALRFSPTSRSLGRCTHVGCSLHLTDCSYGMLAQARARDVYRMLRAAARAHDELLCACTARRTRIEHLHVRMCSQA